MSEIKPCPERCHGARDGDCIWEHCPQLRDNEPATTGRHCPLDKPCPDCGDYPYECICNPADSWPIKSTRSKPATFTPEAIEAANIETERLCRELDITNADHIALWLEANTPDASTAFLACRIIEAHERELAAVHLDATNWKNTAHGCKAKIDELHADRDRASDACASVQKERDELREMLGEALAWFERVRPATDEATDYLNDDGWDDMADLHDRLVAFLARYEGGRN